MQIIKFLIISVALFLFPAFSFASVCDVEGATVIFVNGIFTTREAAEQDILKLQDKYQRKFGKNSARFLLGYNPSHITGIGDLVKSVLQAYKGSWLDYDLTNILSQIHGELKTRKVLLVGHSQGTFYTNAAYEYLIKHGMPAQSMAVYNVATPADRVAGGGKYTTSSTDKVINEVVRELTIRGSARRPLAANVYIPLGLSEGRDKMGGHSFSGVYLASVPEKIIGDMDAGLAGLTAAAGSNGECFAPPKMGVFYNIKGLGFALGDGTASVIAGTAGAVKNTAVALADKVFYFTQNMVFALADMVKSNPKVLVASLDDGQNAPVATPSKSPEGDRGAGEEEPNDQGNAEVIISTQDKIDDILEKIDMLKRQILDLKEPVLADVVVVEPTKEVVAQLSEPNPPSGMANYVSSGGSSSSNNNNVIYPKIIISEVQIAGLVDAKQEFVELYNLNNSEVDLTGWYLQRKTENGASFTTFAPATLFAGKRIPANGYFLIARAGMGFVADIFVDNPLTEHNALALKNPAGEISDRVGFGQANEYELLAAANPPAGRSIGRKMIGGQPHDTNVNQADFEIGQPTPKTANIKYVAPAAAAPPAPTDTLAPQASFTLGAVQKSLNFTVDFTLTDPLGVVSPSGIESYIFRWQKYGGIWQEDAEQEANGRPTSINLKRDFTGQDETNYYFQAKAKDVAGNKSDWLPEAPAETKISLFKKIMINEIQTEGATVKDEFIELYNSNEVDINMADFALKKKTSGGAESNLVSKGAFSGIIKAGEYFLIAPQDWAGPVEPDLRYSGASFSIAGNNTILLYNANDELLDKAGFGTAKDFETAPAATPPAKKSLERKRPGADTDDNSQDFKISDEPTPKGAFPKTILKDATDYSLGASAVVPGAPTYHFLLAWQSRAGNIDFYETQYRAGDGAWLAWISQTKENESQFNRDHSLTGNNIYQFRVRAKDIDGNVGDWSNQITIDASWPIVISEVGYAGTDADPAAQWIEIYNRTQEEIDLAGWRLASGTAGQETLTIALGGKIPAQGYFILEQGDDGALADIAAGQIFTGPIGKNYLRLFAPNGRYVDELYIPNSGFYENSFTQNLPGQASNYYSKERVSVYSFGYLEKSWRLNNGKSINGQDKNGRRIFGTPGQQNSVGGLYTYYPYAFTHDDVLRKEASPYALDSSIAKDVVVRVEPGVVIKFFNPRTGITVSGTLNAVGTESEPIVFTSFHDDEFGGDSGDDGSASLPRPGDWLGLTFTPESKDSVLEHATVRYAGAVFGSSPYLGGNAVWVDNASITLKNSTVEKNKNRALVLANSHSIIDTVKFLDNNSHDYPSGFEESKAINILGGAPQVRNSHFEGNSQGIDINAFHDYAREIIIEALPVIESNTFVKNGGAVHLGSKSYPVFAGNSASENNYNAIIFESDIAKDMVLKADLPYLVKNVSTVPENITLTLEPGVIMAFQSNWAGLLINGTIKAVGTPDKRIIFRPYYHDKDWILPGNWLGLRFSKTSQNSDLEYVDISYAGAFYGNPQNSDFTSGIKVDQSDISLKNSVVQKSANHGIWLVNSPSVIDAVEFLENNAPAGANVAKAVFVEGGAPQIKNSRFAGNYYGIYSAPWHDDVTGEDVPAQPVLENNRFGGNIASDIFPVPVLPSVEPPAPPTESLVVEL